MAISKAILLNKKEGETPLQALEKFRAKNKEYKDVKMTYAGRLDPMAEGLLLILAGEEIAHKEKYLALPKVYEFEVLFGFATDTYDILGKIVNSKRVDISKIRLKSLIRNNLKHFTGIFNQKYPPYSSKTWMKARVGTLEEAPDRKVHIYKIHFMKLKPVTSNILLKNIQRRIKKVKGDFRQKEILKIWHKNLSQPSSKGSPCWIGSLSIKCGSGTYVRGIADSLGKRIGIPALAFSIKRIQIGKYKTGV